MSSLPDIPRANFAVTLDLMRAAAIANQTVLLIGDPGVGKSAICNMVAAELGMPCYTLLGSTLDPTDVGGLPMRASEGDRVIRTPLDEIYQCAIKPGVLFLDEISAAPGPVQAAMLRLILERVAGSVHLHPETRIVAAANPPEQAPAGFELSSPLMGRMCVVHFRPEESEILSYMRDLGSDAEGASDMDKAIRDEAMMWAAVANAVPELLQVDIPKECVSGGQPWGAPRAWERAIRARAAATCIGLDTYGDATYTLTAGSVGQRCAVTYGGVLKMIKELPTVDEIVADPKACPCPSTRDKQVAALGLMPRIAKANLWAAYIYANRLQKEFALAAHKTLMPLAKFQPPLTDPLTKEGSQARAKLSAMIAGPGPAKATQATP